MKKVFIGLAVLLIIGGIIMMVIGGVGFEGFGGYEDYNATATITQDFSTVEINVKRNYIVIEKGAFNEIRYHDSGENLLDFRVHNNVLTIENEVENHIYNQGFMLYLYLNEETYKSFSITTMNAPIKIKDVNTKETIKLKTTNESIILENIQANNIEVETMSGGFEFDSVTADNIEAKGSNGNIKIKNCIVNQYFSSTTSNGGLAINDSEFKQDAKFKTSNGQIDVEDVTFVNAEMVSSNAEVDIENVNASTLKVSTSNGRFKLNDVKTHYITMYTSNAKLEANNLEATSIMAKTSNAKIYLQIKGNAKDYRHIDLTDDIVGVGDYVIATRTSNGSVVISYV